MLKSRSKKKRVSYEFEEQAVGSSRRCQQRNAAERASSGVIPHQPPQGVFREGSEGTALNGKLVCSSWCVVAIILFSLEPESFYSLAWVLSVLLFCFCLFFFLWEGLKREKECTFIAVF